MDEFRESYLKDIRGATSDALAERKIILALSGSIAVVEAPALARELMRRGADVWVCMTPSAARLVTPEAMAWCTGNPVVSELTGWVEHLFLAGEWKGAADLLLVAPATANTVAKMALGIDDTVVTTVATTAIGAKMPVLVAPGMHAVMAEHPAFQENLARLETLGVDIIPPQVAEGKAKMAAVSRIVDAVISRLGRARDLAGRRVLITAGPTVEYIDPVRVVTNLSSGRMGVALAQAAAQRGARVTLVYGPGSAEPPAGVEVIRTVTTRDMHDAVHAAMRDAVFDVSIFAAAVSDFAPSAPAAEKIPTADGTLTVTLSPTPKILNAARAWTDGMIVAFKAETTDSDETLLETARAHQLKSGADLTVANRVGPGRGFQQPENEVYLVAREGDAIHIPMAEKRIVADKIWDAIIPRLGGPRQTGPESTSAAVPGDAPAR